MADQFPSAFTTFQFVSDCPEELDVQHEVIDLKAELENIKEIGLTSTSWNIDII